jgi:hypothetical protein
MTTRRRNVLVLVAVLVLGAAGAWFFSPSVRERPAVSAIPAGAFLIVTLDLQKTRESPIGAELSSIDPISEVSQECGFDPLAHVRTLAIGVPEKPDGVYGVALTHDLPEDDLGKCAQRMMSLRSETPRFTQKGSWTTLEQEGVLAEATRPKIAWRSGSPLLIARGDYLATMQAALDGTAPRADTESQHVALRKVATERARGSVLLVATAVLPKSIRDKIKDEMEGETEQQKTTTMNAILAVRALALSVSSEGDTVHLFVELECENDGACATVRDFLDRKRKAIAAEPAARFAGVGAILDGARLDAHGPSLGVELSAPEPEMARAARAVLGAAFAPHKREVRPAPSASGFSPRP